MSEVTVNQLASTVGIPVERLLAQLQEAGISAVDGEARLTEQEKVQLLGYLRRSHGKAGNDTGPAPSRVTLKRKSVSELRQPAGGGRAPGNVRAATAPRAKTVSVEVRRKRTYVKRGSPAPETEAADTAVVGQVQEHLLVEEPKRAPTAVDRRSELQARRAEEDARRLAEQEEREREAREAEARRRAEEEIRRKEEEEARRKADEEEASRKAADEGKVELAVESPAASEESASESAEAKGKAKKHPKRLAEPSEKEKSVKKAARKDSLRARELVPEVDYEEAVGDEAAPAPTERRPRRKKKAAKPQLQDKHGFQRPTAPVTREVEIPEAISVGDLAGRMSAKVGDVVKLLFKQGMPVTINQMLDSDTATIVVEEMGHIVVRAKARDVEDAMMQQVEEQVEQLEQKVRSPVVTIMGHVDHGKTSLLDHIRRTRVADGEAGGITQHIGAYHVETDRGMISFLDTPGHAAFSAMRARGAKVTDIIVLVVAADDGVMPQTVESIQHARASSVPIVVAVNKIDKPDANPDRVLQELTQQEVVPEEWGGDTMVVKVSAKSGEGIDDLLEALLLQAEVLELTAPEEGPARGTIVESQLDKGRGPVATVLVQAGTLRQGDMIVSGTEFGRVRAMFDEKGRSVKSAGPSIPVQVLGLSGTPNAGDDVVAVADEKHAREVAELRRERERQAKLEEQRTASLDQLFSQFKEGEVQTVNLVIKADVQGSMEALRESLLKLSTDEVKVTIVASGVGGINESDANLAVTSNAILLGFNVRADAAARRIVDDKGLDLRYYSVIYELIDDVKKALSGLLSPEVLEEIIGLAEVRDVFRSSKFGAVAGCMVVEGVIKRNNPIRVLRDNVVIYEGALESLRRFKEDVPEVKAGTECGIGVKNYNDVQVGDHIEVFERTERARSL
ncbi:MAG: translation initiation factor IF-2 [Chromatiaceae bacterium]|jgi:translation initiation factor IF-2|nr:translation initiation factor IF-2 [Chromatiaceae bacterium]